MKNYIGGVILFDETIKQKQLGPSVPELISKNDAIPGSKLIKELNLWLALAKKQLLKV